MTPRSPVTVVALDACDAGIAESFARSGHLPSLGRLFERAARCRVRNPMGIFVGALWPSFATGMRADRHGVHCWDEIEIASYKRHSTAPNYTETPFWRPLSDAGRRVAVLDVPHTKVDAPVNGVQLAEWGCHDRHYGLHTWPHNMAGEIESAFGLHPIFGVDAYAAKNFAPDDYMYRAGALRSIEEDQALIAGLRHGIAAKRDLSSELLAKRDWDFFMTVFGESHAIGHQQWHLHDPSHPRFDAAIAKALGGDPLLRIYQDLDAALGEILAQVGDTETVLVMLSHGMGPHYDGTHLLDEILSRIDRFDHRPMHPSSVMRRAAHALPDSVQRSATAFAVPAMRWCEANLRFKPRREFVRTEQRAEQHFYLAPNNYSYGGVRLNLMGREPNGCVHPDEVETICADLTRDLLSLVNLDTGGPVIQGVARSDRWYRRSPEDTLPDLFLDWERSSLIETVTSPKTGIVHAPYTHWRSGDHRPEGLLLAFGPGIPAATVLPPIGVEDMAPSIAARLGVKLEDVDGKAVPWLAGHR